MQYDPGGELYLSAIFDGIDGCLEALFEILCGAVSVSKTEICRTFICSGEIIDNDGVRIVSVDSILQDTGAQGSNFVSSDIVNKCGDRVIVTELESPRLVRLGNKSIVTIKHEAVLNLSVFGSVGRTYTNTVKCAVLENCSHGVIIGLIDLLGVFYYLFESSIRHGRSKLGNSDKPVDLYRGKTVSFDSSIYECSPLGEKSVTTTVSVPDFETIDKDMRDPLYIDNEGYKVYYPWSQPLDEIAPEELETPDCLSFPDDILNYLTVSHEEAVQDYLKCVSSHVIDEFRKSSPRIDDILTNEYYINSVWVPTVWNGLKMEPVHLKVKPGMPDSLKPANRMVRPDLYDHAKREFLRMSTYFYTESKSPILVP